MEESQYEECFVEEVQLKSLTITPDHAIGKFSFADERISIVTDHAVARASNGRILSSIISPKISKLYNSGQECLGDVVTETDNKIVLRTRDELVTIYAPFEAYKVEREREYTFENTFREECQATINLDVSCDITTHISGASVSQIAKLTNRSSINILGVDDATVLYPSDMERSESRTEILSLDKIKDIPSSSSVVIPISEHIGITKRVTTVSKTDLHSPRLQDIVITPPLIRSEVTRDDPLSYSYVNNGDTCVVFDLGPNPEVKCFRSLRSVVVRNDGFSLLAIRVSETQEEFDLMPGESINI